MQDDKIALTLWTKEKAASCSGGRGCFSMNMRTTGGKSPRCALLYLEDYHDLYNGASGMSSKKSKAFYKEWYERQQELDRRNEVVLNSLTPMPSPSDIAILLTLADHSLIPQEALNVVMDPLSTPLRRRAMMREILDTISKNLQRWREDGTIARVKLEIEQLYGITRFEEYKAPFGLTLREIEVAHLLIENLTHAEIGRRLDISKNTVDTHSRNIKAKISDDLDNPSLSKADIIGILKENI